MSDIARTADGDGGGSTPAAVVPTVGTVLSGVILAALLLPVRRGVDHPAVWLAAAGALAATVAFVGRRHGRLDRTVAGSVAAGGSVLVVVCAGYAIARGVLGSVPLPGLDRSVSLLFVALFAAMAAAGVGIAERGALSGRELQRRAARTLEVGVLALVGLYSISIAALFLGLPVMIVAGELSEFQVTLIQYPAYAVGLGGVAAGYLAYRGRDRSFVDLEAPTLRTVGWIVAGLILIVGANVAIAELMAALGIESSEHSTTQQVAENPDLLWIVVPSMVLFVGPFEELLYRNVIQKSLYERFSRAGAVLVGSVVFTLVHVTAYATAGPDRLLASLSLLFVLALILGTLYERTENLLVPALVHGCYNAVIFLQMIL